MTGMDYRRLHGDPANWTDDEYEVFLASAKPGGPLPTPEPADYQPAA